MVGASVGLVVAGPLGAIAGAVLPPTVKLGIEVARDYAQNHQSIRIGQVIAMAADEASLTSHELAERLKSSPDKEELFVRTMRAAADAASLRKLVALSRALASGALESSPAQLEWEILFVKAVAALDEPHLTLLERFEWSASRLGLGDVRVSPDFDKPVNSLNLVQMRMVLPVFESVLDSLVATLDSQGLITAYAQDRGPGPGGDWRLTPFGRLLLDRLRQVGEPLQETRTHAEQTVTP